MATVAPETPSNPPINIFTQALDAYSKIKIASIQQKGMANPPPGSYSYSPQNDTKQNTKNFVPDTGIKTLFNAGNLKWLIVAVIVIVAAGAFLRSK